MQVPLPVVSSMRMFATFGSPCVGRSFRIPSFFAFSKTEQKSRRSSMIARQLRASREQILCLGRLQRGVHRVEIRRRDVEAFDDVFEIFAGNVGNEILEAAEHRSRLERVVGALHFLVGDRGGDVGDRAPDFAVPVHVEVFAVARADDLRQLPDAVGGFVDLFELLVAHVRHDAHVVHDVFRLGENRAADALQDEALFRKRRAEDDAVGVVDVAGTEGLDGNEPPGDGELFCDQGCVHF